MITTFSSRGKQVEATTKKWAVVTGRDGPGYRDTKCPEKTGRPVLTGICAIISLNSYFVLQSLLRK